jgi:CBS domain-containing protein
LPLGDDDVSGDEYTARRMRFSFAARFRAWVVATRAWSGNGEAGWTTIAAAPLLSRAGSYRGVPTMSATVRDMLRGKATVYSVGPGDTVYAALRLMADKNIGAVLVRSDQKIDGILSERDYARKVILLGKTSRETLVSEIMTTRVVSVDPDWTAGQCMALMTEKRIRHLPVMEQGGLVGIVSIGDVVRAVVDEQKFTIDSLQRYITS